MHRAAEEGRAAAEEQSTSFPALLKIIGQLRRACGDPGKQQPGPTSNGASVTKDIEIDPLLGSRIHLGF